MPTIQDGAAAESGGYKLLMKVARSPAVVHATDVGADESAAPVSDPGGDGDGGSLMANEQRNIAGSAGTDVVAALRGVPLALDVFLAEAANSELTRPPSGRDLPLRLRLRRQVPLEQQLDGVQRARRLVTREQHGAEATFAELPHCAARTGA